MLTVYARRPRASGLTGSVGDSVGEGAGDYPQGAGHRVSRAWCRRGHLGHEAEVEDGQAPVGRAHHVAWVRVRVEEAALQQLFAFSLNLGLVEVCLAGTGAALEQLSPAVGVLSSSDTVGVLSSCVAVRS